jgi:hypothetical protein
VTQVSDVAHGPIVIQQGSVYAYPYLCFWNWNRTFFFKPRDLTKKRCYYHKKKKNNERSFILCFIIDRWPTAVIEKKYVGGGRVNLDSNFPYNDWVTAERTIHSIALFVWNKIPAAFEIDRVTKFTAIIWIKDTLYAK